MLSALMHGNCSIAMLLTQLLAGLIVFIAVLGSDGNRTLGKDVSTYPWIRSSTTHRMPYKVSGDI